MKTVLVYLCLILVVVSTKGQNQTNSNERTLHVQGIAILKQTPEMISVSINIKTEAKEYGSCQDKLLMNLQKAKANFINKGIEKSLINTNYLQISENKTYNRNGEEVKLGFIGSASILIESTYSVTFTKNLLSALNTDSILSNYSISFRLSESQKQLLRKNAILNAIQDAKEKANLISESSNIRLEGIKSIVYNDEIVSVTENGDITRESLLRTSYNKGTDDIAVTATDFNPKEIKIVKAVDVVWSIKDKNQN